MQKVPLMLIGLACTLQSFSQTTITQLSPIAVRTHWVNPVKIEGNSELFFFEGFAGQKTGCFKVHPGGIIRTECDKFTFEFAENLNGNPNTPLYFIKRTDGKYLSLQLGGADFVDKMADQAIMFQKFLVCKVQSQYNPNFRNAYNFLLPLPNITYGYTLKMFNNYKEMGFSTNAKIRAIESEFYLGQTPVNVKQPDKN